MGIWDDLSQEHIGAFVGMAVMCLTDPFPVEPMDDEARQAMDEMVREAVQELARRQNVTLPA